MTGAQCNWVSQKRLLCTYEYAVNYWGAQPLATNADAVTIFGSAAVEPEIVKEPKRNVRQDQLHAWRLWIMNTGVMVGIDGIEIGFTSRSFHVDLQSCNWLKRYLDWVKCRLFPEQDSGMSRWILKLSSPWETRSPSSQVTLWSQEHHRIWLLWQRLQSPQISWKFQFPVCKGFEYSWLSTSDRVAFFNCPSNVLHLCSLGEGAWHRLALFDQCSSEDPWCKAQFTCPNV